MKDIAPHIFRQRCIIEGYTDSVISSNDITEYLSGLSEEIGMVTLVSPVTHRSEKYGWAGWIHWETSGAHFYAWDEPKPFFSVDIYTCKQFETDIAVSYTKDFFAAVELVYKNI